MADGEQRRSPVLGVPLLVSIFTLVALVTTGVWAIFRYVGDVEREALLKLDVVSRALDAQVKAQVEDSTGFRIEISNLRDRLDAFVSGSEGDRWTGTQQMSHEVIEDLKRDVLAARVEIAEERLRRSIDQCCGEIEQ